MACSPPKIIQTLQQRVVSFRRVGLTCPSSVYFVNNHSAFTQHHAVQKFEWLKYSNSFLRILWMLIIVKIHYLWRARLPKSFQTLQQRVVSFRRFGLTCPSSVYLKTEKSLLTSLFISLDPVRCMWNLCQIGASTLLSSTIPKHLLYSMLDTTSYMH